ncbi:exopolyphosphatase [Alphaproteobacteria bacterium]|nr:exopolyphosphatase [Alphaproteobacteria bacterium]
MSLDALNDNKRHRLITRSDFDGLVSAMLLSDLGVVSSILFAHPNDVQNKAIEVTGDDILSNLPYHENALLVFDHHASERLRVPTEKDNWVIDTAAPSAARLIWRSFGGDDYFNPAYKDMLEAVDKADTGSYTLDEVLEPSGWVLLNFIMDSRTGFGRFGQFKISNYKLMSRLIDLCRQHPIGEVMADPDVAERADFYRAEQPLFTEQLRAMTTERGKVCEVNLLETEIIHVGNRFLIYALFPECKVSMHKIWGKNGQTVSLACGRSIFNKDNRINIGEIMLKYGGGGHRGAGTCQVPLAKLDEVKERIINEINETLSDV